VRHWSTEIKLKRFVICLVLILVSLLIASVEANVLLYSGALLSNCQQVNYSNNHITIEMTTFVLGLWRITGYYGHPNGEHRRAAWDFL